MKVYVWAGNGLREVTEICIFNGTMDADLYCEIIQETLPIKYSQELVSPWDVHKLQPVIP